MRPSSPPQPPPVQIVRPILSAFLTHIEGSFRRHFHAVLLHVDGRPPAVPARRPLVVYLNHASWWDPLVMMWLGRRCYPGRSQYGPIEASQLERYSFFKYLGVFGIEKGTVSGARRFLRVSEAILARDGAMIWLTPQGRFADVRERPSSFASGLAHLALRQPEAVFVPLALEYGFGAERLPEIRLRFGIPMEGAAIGGDVAQTQARLERSLEETMDALARAVIEKHEDAFETLLSGKGGASLPYDLWRRLKALLRGERPRLNHSEVP